MTSTPRRPHRRRQRHLAAGGVAREGLPAPRRRHRGRGARAHLMAVAIRMPMPGQMTEECTVLQWFKKEGDRVVRGDPLFEIETDKSNMEIEAFDEGVLLRIDAPEGATVPVEAIVAWIGQPGEDIPAAVAAVAAVAARAAGAPLRSPGTVPGATSEDRVPPPSTWDISESRRGIGSGGSPGSRAVSVRRRRRSLRRCLTPASQRQPAAGRGRSSSARAPAGSLPSSASTRAASRAPSGRSDRRARRPGCGLRPCPGSANGHARETTVSPAAPRSHRLRPPRPACLRCPPGRHAQPDAPDHRAAADREHLGPDVHRHRGRRHDRPAGAAGRAARPSARASR